MLAQIARVFCEAWEWIENSWLYFSDTYHIFRCSKSRSTSLKDSKGLGTTFGFATKQTLKLWLEAAAVLCQRWYMAVSQSLHSLEQVFLLPCLTLINGFFHKCSKINRLSHPIVLSTFVLPSYINYIPIPSMGLLYLPTFTTQKSTIHVGKYPSPSRPTLEKDPGLQYTKARNSSWVTWTWQPLAKSACAIFVNRLASLKLTVRTCQEAIPKGKYILKPCNLVSGKVVRAACSLYIVGLSFAKTHR